MTALVLSGGPGHPVSASADGLRDVLGADLAVTEDIDAGLTALDPERHDLLVVNALAFGMRDDRYDEATRAAHAFHLGDEGRRAIETWVGAGHPVLALHTAVICFDDWPRWGALVGGRWNWDRSWHPPIGPIDVNVSIGSADSFTVVDERYTDLDLSDDVEVLATSDRVPVAWRRLDGEARVACSTLGHDERSLGAPEHRSLLRTLAAWLLEER